MASAAVLGDTEEKCIKIRLVRLLIDGGTEALRRAFDTVHSPANLQGYSHTHKGLLTSLRKKGILSSSQWDKLYPPSGAAPDSKTFDITLLFVLLRNICGLAAPAAGWDTLPPAADVSREANLVRVKLYRNQVYSYVTGTGVSKADFEQYWSDITSALIALGADQTSIDLLKSSAVGETEYLSLLSKWKIEEETLKEVVSGEIKRFEETIGNKFENLKESVKIVEENVKTVQENVKTVECKVKEILQQPVRQVSLLETLSQCEFTRHITSLVGQHHKGTRLWAMDKIEAFCSDSRASAKALVITALSGVGKSVLASDICKDLQEKGTLGACHFIQHNNSQCNNPRVVIESVTRHLCENVDGFKDKLDCRLTPLLPYVRNELDNMNLETLTTVLLRNPLKSVKNSPENYFVVIIDVLDECESSTRDEFVKMLLSKWRSMPQWIKLVCTSRPNKQLPKELSHVTVLDIATADACNTEDVQLFLSSHLGRMFPDETYEHREAVVSNLTVRSDGLFLFANFAVESAKSRGLSLAEISEIFPKGISSVYEEYLVHLQAELGVDEELFMNFLQAVVASRAPLPASLVLQIFGLSQTIRQEKKQAHEALKPLALLFPVEEKRVSIFHNSLTDWLTQDEDEGHDFSVKLQDGNRVLARHCLKVLREVKNHKSFPPELNDSEKYSLMFGFHHMREGEGFKEQLAECMQDLELLSAMAVVGGKKTKDGCVQISGCAVDSFCSELERICRDCSIDLLCQDLKHLLEVIRSKRDFVQVPAFAPQFVLECAAKCPASAEIKAKAVGLLSSPKYKHCAWVDEHTVYTLEPDFFLSDLSCNEHTTVVCVKAYNQLDSKRSCTILKLSLETDQQPASAAVGLLGCCYGPKIEICPNDKHLLVYYQLRKLEKKETANWPLALEIRNVQTLQLQRKSVLDFCSEIDSSCLIRDNKLVVGCRDGTVHMLDVDCGVQETPLYIFPDNPHVYCTASSGGKLLTMGGGEALLWHSLIPPEHVALTSGVISDAYQPVCFSPDGRFVACACYGSDECHATLKVFNAQTTQLVNSLLVDYYSPCTLTFITNVHLMLDTLLAGTYIRDIRIDNGLFQEISRFIFGPVHCIGEGKCVCTHLDILYKQTFHNLI